MREAEFGKKTKQNKPPLNSNINKPKLSLLVFKQKSWALNGYNLIQEQLLQSITCLPVTGKLLGNINRI